MSPSEETIPATLDANGQLQLAHLPQVSPGPVQVTIRTATSGQRKKTVADVIEEISQEQRASGFPGRTTAEIQAYFDEQAAEDEERDRELDAARDNSSSKGT